NAATHLQSRQGWRPSRQSHRATECHINDGDRGTLVLRRFRSSPTPARFGPAKAGPVHRQEVVSIGRITLRYPPSDILPQVGQAPDRAVSEPIRAHKFDRGSKCLVAQDGHAPVRPTLPNAVPDGRVRVCQPLRYGVRLRGNSLPMPKRTNVNVLSPARLYPSLFAQAGMQKNFELDPVLLLGYGLGAAQSHKSATNSCDTDFRALREPLMIRLGQLAPCSNAS